MMEGGVSCPAKHFPKGAVVVVASYSWGGQMTKIELKVSITGYVMID